MNFFKKTLKDGQSKILLSIFFGIIVLYALAFFLITQRLVEEGITIDQFVTPQADATIYRELANDIVTFGDFRSQEGPSPEFFRTPVYPFFLAVLIFIQFGSVGIVLTQIVLAGFTGVLIYLVIRKLLSPKASMFALVISMLSPPTILAPMMTLTETFFTFLTALMLYLLSILSERQEHLYSVLLGVTIGALVLTRPTFLIIAPLVLCFVLFVGRKNIRSAMLRALLVTFIATSCVVPWVMRNAYLGGHATISTIGAYNTLFHNVVEFESFRRNVSKDEIVKEIRVSLGDPEGWRLSTFEYFDRENELVKGYLGAHFTEYFMFHLLKSASFFLGSGVEFSQRTLAEFNVIENAPKDVNLSSLILSGNVNVAITAMKETPLSLLETFLRMLLLATCSMYVLMLIIRRSEVAMLALFMLMLFVAIGLVAGPLAIPRYRIPVEPYFIALSIGGIIELIKIRKGGVKLDVFARKLKDK